MLVFRSFAIGLTAACLALLVIRPGVVVVHAVEPRPSPSVVADPAPTIIDVARGVRPAQLASMLRFADGEHVIAVDGVATASDVAAGVELERRDPGGRRFIDLTVAGPTGIRRMLVLMH